MELIDREKLQTTIRNMVEIHNEVRVKVLGAVSRAKKVDAVEVVRCKDCRHFDEYNCKCYVFCDNEYEVQLEVDRDHFCSYGERRK